MLAFVLVTGLIAGRREKSYQYRESIIIVIISYAIPYSLRFICTPTSLISKREVEVYRIRVEEGDVLARKLMGSLAEVEGRALQEKVRL